MSKKGKLQYVGLKKGCSVKMHKLGKKEGWKPLGKLL
jgi:hypothetical protein